MSTKAKRRTSRSYRKQRKGTRRQPASCRALMIIDEVPLRKRAVQGCRQTLRALERARMEWDRFENEDRPRFERWHSSTFGEQLTGIRTLKDRLSELNQFVWLVEHIRDRDGFSNRYKTTWITA